MQNRILQTFGTAALAAGVFASAGAFAQNNGHLSEADMKFAHNAAQGGMEEVQLGKIAVQNASNDQVKQFGQRMVDDHTKAGDELKALASKENITLPGDLDGTQRAMVDKFSNMKGAGFDKTYMHDMVQDHEKDIAEFQKEASSGTDPGLRDWAAKTIPTLQEHLRLAKEASKAVGAMSMK